MDKAQRKHLFKCEKRVGAWLAFLQYQHVTPGELTRIVKFPSAALSSFVVQNPYRFKFDQRSDRDSILENATSVAKLRWLAASKPGEYMEQAHRWLEDIAMLTEIRTVPGERGFLYCQRNLLNLLADQRPDLIGTLLAIGGRPYRAVVAASSSLRSAEHQLRLVGLEGDLPNSSKERFSAWFNDHEHDILALCENPRTHLAVLKKVNESLRHTIWLVNTAKKRNLLHVIDEVRSRLSLFAKRPAVTEDYESVTDLSTLMFLFNRCVFSSTGISQHPFDVARLIANENLPARQRRRLTRTMASRDSGLVCREALSAKKLRRDIWTNSPSVPALRTEKRSHEVCDQTCHGTLTCGKARCSSMSWKGFGGDFVELFTESLLDDEAHNLCQSSPADEWIVDELGTAPAVYATVLMLFSGWQGTMDDLIETSKSLLKASDSSDNTAAA